MDAVAVTVSILTRNGDHADIVFLRGVVGKFSQFVTHPL